MNINSSGDVREIKPPLNSPTAEKSSSGRKDQNRKISLMHAVFFSSIIFPNSEKENRSINETWYKGIEFYKGLRTRRNFRPGYLELELKIGQIKGNIRHF